MAQPLRHLQYSRGLKHRKTTRKQGGKWWVTQEFPTKINRTAEQPMERVIKRWKRKLPGGSKTWRSWHRMGMLLHTGGGLWGCKCREDSRKSIIEETGYHKGALLLEWNMLWGHPRSLGLRIHDRKALWQHATILALWSSLKSPRWKED